MKCPVCPDTNLAMSTREGVEIDYCPQCRGVWLDRGELDKIIERSDTDDAPPRQPPPPNAGYGQQRRYDSDYGYRGKKKKNLLKELLDF